MRKIVGISLIFLLLSIFEFAYSEPVLENNFRFSFEVGYGDSDWSFLKSDVPAVQFVTPSSASSAGLSEGLFVGYLFSRRFLGEIGYTRIADETLTFHDPNYYKPNAFSIISKTELFDLDFEFIVPIMSSKFFSYASLGAAYTHRHDELADLWNLGALFGGGLGYHINDRYDTELGFQYTTGMAKAAMYPSNDYIPFSYFAFFKVGVSV